MDKAMFIQYVTTCTVLTDGNHRVQDTAVWTAAHRMFPRTHAAAKPVGTQPRKQYQPKLTYCWLTAGYCYDDKTLFIAISCYVLLISLLLLLISLQT